MNEEKDMLFSDIWSMNYQDDMMGYQMAHIDNDLKDIYTSYYKITKDRYDDKLSDDEKVIYELMDMIDPLKAVVQEAASDFISAKYMVEKLYHVKNFVDYAYNYYLNKIDR